MVNKIKAIIFDMDGVIFDSESIYHKSFMMTAEKYNLDFKKEYTEQFVGRSTPDCLIILQNLFNHDYDKTQRFFNDWKLARLSILEKKRVDFKLGFVDLFSCIKENSIKKVIVTSANLLDLKENFSQKKEIRMDDFTHIITIDLVKHPKPNPEPYLLALKKLQLAAEDCVVVEDSVTGASAAVAAGIKTIMLADNVKPDKLLSEQLWFVAESHEAIKLFLTDYV